MIIAALNPRFFFAPPAQHTCPGSLRSISHTAWRKVSLKESICHYNIMAIQANLLAQASLCTGSISLSQYYLPGTFTLTPGAPHSRPHISHYGEGIGIIFTMPTARPAGSFLSQELESRLVKRLLLSKMDLPKSNTVHGEGK